MYLLTAETILLDLRFLPKLTFVLQVIITIYLFNLSRSCTSKKKILVLSFKFSIKYIQIRPYDAKNSVLHIFIFIGETLMMLYSR